MTKGSSKTKLCDKKSGRDKKSKNRNQNSKVDKMVGARCETKLCDKKVAVTKFFKNLKSKLESWQEGSRLLWNKVVWFTLKDLQLGPTERLIICSRIASEYIQCDTQQCVLCFTRVCIEASSFALALQLQPSEYVWCDTVYCNQNIDKFNCQRSTSHSAPHILQINFLIKYIHNSQILSGSPVFCVLQPHHLLAGAIQIALESALLNILRIVVVIRISFASEHLSKKKVNMLHAIRPKV